MSKPRLIDVVELFKGLRFSVVRKKYTRDSGFFERDVVVFPEAVVVLPFIDSRNILLIKQYRSPLDEYVVEAPAGVVDPGEKPDETAERELIEETGYRPRRLHKLGSYIPTPGYSTEVLYFYYADGLEYVGIRPEKYEVIEPFVIGFNDAYRMVLNNEIVDMKTSLIILLYREKYGDVK